MTDTQTQEQEQLAPEYPEAWRPQQGDSLKGEIVSIEAIDPSGQGVYPVVTLKGETGAERAVHAFHGVLRRELAKRRPQVGDTITIHYLGKRPGGKNPDGYHNYRVTGGTGVAYDWATDLPPEERVVETEAVPIAPAPAPVPPAAPAAANKVDDDLPF